MDDFIISSDLHWSLCSESLIHHGIKVVCFAGFHTSVMSTKTIVDINVNEIESRLLSLDKSIHCGSLLKMKKSLNW